MKSTKYMLLGIAFLVFAVACCAASARLGEGLAIMALPIAIIGIVLCFMGFFKEDDMENKTDKITDDKNNKNDNK